AWGGEPMRLLLAVVGAFALLSASGVAHAISPPPPPPERAATLSPEPVEPGGRVTVDSVDPCPAGPEGESGWLLFAVLDDHSLPIPLTEGLPPDATFSISLEFGIPAPAIVPNEDGSWTATFDAPEAEGSYPFLALCVQLVESGEQPGGPITPNPCEDPEFADDPANEGLCEPDGDGLPNPCEDEEFARAHEDMCAEIVLNPVVDLDATAIYRLQFDVVAAAEPPPPVIEQPTFTG
ncbi:MAG TPA: hypothetical protein VFZ68_04770, partial [Acidimicrobiales bacterium]